MQRSEAPKFSLDALLSTELPSLDTAALPVDDGVPKKFKRSRPSPGQAAPPASAPTLASTFTSASTMESTPAPTQAQKPPSKKRKQPQKQQRQHKQPQQPLSADMAIAAAAATATVSADAGSGPSNTSTASNINHGNGNRKRRKQLSGRPQPTKNAESSGSLIRRRKETQKHYRNLDAMPEAVGVSTNKDDDMDFSTLLLKHVEHTNKILQRDLEIQNEKMLKEQKLQTEQLKAQAAAVLQSTTAAATLGSAKDLTSTTNATASALMPQNQHIQEQLNGKQKKPFVPRKNCNLYLKGSCRREVCNFKHDPEALKAKMLEPPPEEVRKARGICKFEKSGSCTKGDLCLYSHDLSGEPCTFYHLKGVCERGALCRFGHQPISPEELESLREKSFQAKSQMQSAALVV
ncbi:hypothetical protein BGZ99_008681 [Dissophora globulifera]|uniref:C3H1-type domain-containing protein n=1 Tax=Dissophora globulifera TaxID=979702 RepID=A0A9P6UP96_9FUNG|nr:hypothetical protein BGZ99_008681 [Dissophora globulifera]